MCLNLSQLHSNEVNIGTDLHPTLDHIEAVMTFQYPYINTELFSLTTCILAYSVPFSFQAPESTSLNLPLSQAPFKTNESDTVYK